MDNVISFDEFTSLMRQAKPDEDNSAAELTRMYREAAQLSEPGDTLEHDEFMAVAKRCECAGLAAAAPCLPASDRAPLQRAAGA